MKTTSIVTKGRAALKAAIAEYEEENKPPAGAKNAHGKPMENAATPGYKRKVAAAFLTGYNLHEAFMEDILGTSE